MAKASAFVVIMVAILGISSLAAAVPGTATYYTVYKPSSCYGFEEKGVMIAAASPTLFANRAACGRRYSVRCTGGTNQTPNPCRGGSVTVTVVDLCPGCQGNSLDLSLEAFRTIANPDAGRVKIDFTQV